MLVTFPELTLPYETARHHSENVSFFHILTVVDVFVWLKEITILGTQKGAAMGI